ncbi:hypothetical protein P886_0711 [Alteromonadaceae bacterium 2753L.S.0a.02]|nr:hypothetical protein P886_0711 [Alteromonadaceae bacterium 2753L.S.0a.02]
MTTWIIIALLLLLMGLLVLAFVVTQIENVTTKPIPQLERLNHRGLRCPGARILT